MLWSDTAFVRLLVGFFSAGIQGHHNLEDRLRIRVINIISFICIAVLLFFGTTTLWNGDVRTGSFDLSVALIFFITYVYLRKTGVYAVIKYLWIGSTGALFIYLFNTGGVGNTGHLWVYIFPVVAAFLLGARKGAMAILAVMVAIVVLWLIDFFQGKAANSTGLIIRFVVSYSIISYSICYYEQFRQKTLGMLETSNFDLDKQISRLKEAEEALKKNQAELERRIEERTSELKEANERLHRAHDVLEMRVDQRTEELKKTNEALESANRAKSDFLANMSHELRTPLHHIMGFTELLAGKHCGELNEMQEEYLKDVLQSSEHLLSLINDILDLSKVEAGKLELVATEIRLLQLLKSSMSMVKLQAIKHDIRFLTNVDDSIQTIRADERKLKQIIYNLLSNAVKFTPDGGLITISAQRLYPKERQWFTTDGQPVVLPLDGDDPLLTKERLIEISVTDTGIGLLDAELKLIFNPFEQADNSLSRRYQGTGLGLSLTKKLVELHGGWIWAQSEGKGKGSKFIFVIPV